MNTSTDAEAATGPAVVKQSTSDLSLTSTTTDVSSIDCQEEPNSHGVPSWVSKTSFRSEVQCANYPRKVTVIGNGYVGLPLAVLMNDRGHDVTGFDVDEERVALHNAGVSTVDDVHDFMLEGIAFTKDPRDITDSEVFVICVPTPVTKEKLPDLSIIKAVKEMLLQTASPGSLIVLESTVGVGDTRRTFADMVTDGFFVANSPERIDPARTFPALRDIPKVVGGVDQRSTVKAVNFYDTIFTSVVPVLNSDHSEATKLLENSFRAVNISFINEFSNFCQAAGLDVDDIVDGASTKPYGFMPFRSGLGVGGHCIPVDPHYLIECSNNGENDWPILANCMKSIHERPGMLAQSRLEADEGMQRVLICGVSYKPNVSDIREAPQSGFVKKLRENGIDVDFFDPLVESFESLNRVNEISPQVASTYDRVYVMHKHSVCTDELEQLRGLPNVEFF